MRADHWIDGHSVPSLSGDYLPTLNPMTPAPWAELARGRPFRPVIEPGGPTHDTAPGPSGPGAVRSG